MSAGRLAGAAAASFLAGGASAETPASPITVSAGYTAELWRNARGGLRVGGVYLDKLEAGVTFDAEAAFAWSGVRAAVSAMRTNGARLSGPLVGDTHTVSNIDAPRVLALQDAWVEIDRGVAALKAGVIDLNSEFDVNQAGGLFVNSAHGIGPDFSQAGAAGPSIFPVPGLGARALVRMGDWTVRVGGFDGLPASRRDSRRQTFSLGRRDGALVVAEAETSLRSGWRVMAGAWRHSGVAGVADTAVRAGRGRGAYALVEPTPLSWRGRRVATFLRVGGAVGPDLPVSRYVGLGAALDGGVTGGEGEQLGLALAWARHRRAGDEVNLELTYRRRLFPGVAVQPSLQWISRPGGVRQVRDAFVAGLRLEMAWSSAEF